MTLLELCRLLKTKLTFVVGLPVILTIVVFAGCALAFPHSYEAESTLVTSADLTVVGGIATSQAEGASADGVEVEAKSTTTNATVTFTASGSDPSACVNAANAAAQTTQKKINESYPDTIADVTAASQADDASHSPWKYALVAFFVGLFIAIVLVVIQDMIVRKVHDWASVEQAGQVRYLGTYGGDEAQRERLAVATRLAGRGSKADMAESVCLVPVGSTPFTARVADEIESSLPEPHARILVAEPLSRGPEAILDAREADSTVLVVQEELSTFGDLEDVLRELSIASVEPAGFVYVTAKSAKA